MVCERKRDDPVVVPRQLLDFFHLRPVVNPDLAVITADVEVGVQELHGEGPPSKAFD